MNGPVATLVTGTTDVQAPGAPTLSNWQQTSNTGGAFDAQLPSADADNSPLTGLKGLNYVTVLGNDPLAGQTADQIAASGLTPTAVALTDTDAGTVKAGLAAPVLAAGQTQTVYAWCND